MLRDYSSDPESSNHDLNSLKCTADSSSNTQNCRKSKKQRKKVASDFEQKVSKFKHSEKRISTDFNEIF